MRGVGLAAAIALGCGGLGASGEAAHPEIDQCREAIAALMGDDPQARVGRDQAADGKACARAGFLYQEGADVPQDSKMALGFFELGCRLDSADACGAAGTCFEYGVGGSQDTMQATTFYMRACDLGDQRSCDSLNHGLLPPLP